MRHSKTVCFNRKRMGKWNKNFQQMLINHMKSVPKSPPLSAVLETANLALSFIEGSPGLWTDGFKNSGRGCCYLRSNLVSSRTGNM